MANEWAVCYPMSVTVKSTNPISQVDSAHRALSWSDLQEILLNSIKYSTQWPPKSLEKFMPHLYLHFHSMSFPSWLINVLLFYFYFFIPTLDAREPTQMGLSTLPTGVTCPSYFVSFLFPLGTCVGSPFHGAGFLFSVGSLRSKSPRLWYLKKGKENLMFICWTSLDRDSFKNSIVKHVFLKVIKLEETKVKIQI